MPAFYWTTSRELRLTWLRSTLVKAQNQDCPRVGMHLTRRASPKLPEFLSYDIHQRVLSGDTVVSRCFHRKHLYFVHVGPLRDDRNEIQGVRGMALDVTRRKGARPVEDRTK